MLYFYPDCVFLEGLYLLIPGKVVPPDSRDRTHKIEVSNIIIFYT